ncbi:MAG: hypothetical protein IJV22_02105 [Bacteroidales bacterium]|nr:hypothetical protein [Bacteroidales bacterium]
MDLEEYASRRNRPLPSKGCSTLFFVLFVLLLTALLLFFLYYRTHSAPAAQ